MRPPYPRQRFGVRSLRFARGAVSLLEQFESTGGKPVAREDTARGLLRVYWPRIEACESAVIGHDPARRKPSVCAPRL